MKSMKLRDLKEAIEKYLKEHPYDDDLEIFAHGMKADAVRFEGSKAHNKRIVNIV